VLEIAIVTAIGTIVYLKLQPKVISMIPDNFVYAVEPAPLTVDEMVDKYSAKYGKTVWLKNRTKVMLHFLLLREQNYGGSNNCGDSGKACGPLQYHQPTYIGYRTIMMNKKLVDHMGTRLDMEDAIETTAWAINDKRETAWGPIARNEIKL
jgi:hypothetical protein